MRKLFAIILVLVLIIALVGCGTNKDSNPDTAPPSENVETTNPTEDNTFDFSTAEKFPICFGETTIELPMSYTDFMNNYDFKESGSTTLGLADDPTFVLSGELNNEYKLALHLRPSEDFRPITMENPTPDFEHTSVMGIDIYMDSGAKLDFEYSENDTFESTLAKFGTPKMKLEEPFWVLRYETSNVKIGDKPFVVDFLFDMETKKLDHIMLGNCTSIYG